MIHESRIHYPRQWPRASRDSTTTGPQRRKLTTLLGPYSLIPTVELLVLQTTPINTPDTQQATGANPAWRDSLWHLLSVAGWPGTPDSATSLISAAASAALDNIKQPLPVQAAYLDEADPTEENWQHVFFGANYDRLVQVKQKWDPNNVLNCYKCLGYLGPQDPMYSCHGDNPVPSTPYPFLSKRTVPRLFPSMYKLSGVLFALENSTTKS